MIIGVSNGNERTFDAAGSLTTRFGKSETPTRATRSIGRDAAAPEPRLAPHTKRAEQHKTPRDARLPRATAKQHKQEKTTQAAPQRRIA